MKRTSPFMFYLCYYAALAFYMPFIVLYFQGLGFNGVQIGLLTGIAPLITMVSAPFWTGLADYKQRHKLIMSLTLIVVIALAIIFPLLKTLAPVILLVCMFSLFAAPIISFADSATLTMLANEKELYGCGRLGGTIGWGLMAPAAGMLIQAYGIKLAFWGYAVVMSLALIIGQKFTYGQKVEVASLGGNVRQMLANRRWFFSMPGIRGWGSLCLHQQLPLPVPERSRRQQNNHGLRFDDFHPRRTAHFVFCQPLAQTLQGVWFVRSGISHHRTMPAAICRV
jgi:MFS family permease